MNKIIILFFISITSLYSMDICPNLLKDLVKFQGVVTNNKTRLQVIEDSLVKIDFKIKSLKISINDNNYRIIKLKEKESSTWSFIKKDNSKEIKWLNEANVDLNKQVDFLNALSSASKSFISLKNKNDQPYLNGLFFILENKILRIVNDYDGFFKKGKLNLGINDDIFELNNYLLTNDFNFLQGPYKRYRTEKGKLLKNYYHTQMSKIWNLGIVSEREQKGVVEISHYFELNASDVLKYYDAVKDTFKKSTTLNEVDSRTSQFLSMAALIKSAGNLRKNGPERLIKLVNRINSIYEKMIDRDFNITRLEFGALFLASNEFSSEMFEKQAKHFLEIKESLEVLNEDVSEFGLALLTQASKRESKNSEQIVKEFLSFRKKLEVSNKRIFLDYESVYLFDNYLRLNRKKNTPMDDFLLGYSDAISKMNKNVIDDFDKNFLAIELVSFSKRTDVPIELALDLSRRVMSLAPDLSTFESFAILLQLKVNKREYFDSLTDLDLIKIIEKKRDLKQFHRPIFLYIASIIG